MRRRVVLSVLLAPVVCVALGLATSSWWLGAALGWAGPRWLDTDFESYERLGFSRFALNGVAVQRPEVTVSVARVEADSPLAWLAGRLGGRSPGAVVAGEWSVVVPVSDDAPVEETDFGWVGLEAMLSRVAAGLNEWLPEARLASGEVVWPGGRLVVGPAQWADGRLEVERVAWGERAAVSVAVGRGDEGWSLAARDAGNDWSVEAVARGAEVSARGAFWEQPWSASATFAETGWRPEVAEFVASDWSVSGERLGLDRVYADVSGLARARWAAGAFEFSVEAAGAPAGDAPALKVALGGRGDGGGVVVERIAVRAPGVTATLDEPVRITSAGELVSAVSRFNFEADLAEWPGLDASGSVRGSATVKPGAEGRPEVRAAFTAKAVELADWRVDAVSAEAEFKWPEVVVTSAAIALPGGERLAVSGRWDIPGRVLTDGKVAGRLTVATLGPWVPEGMVFEEVVVSATAQGVWPNLTHAGSANVSGFSDGEWLRALEVAAEWRGLGMGADEVVVTAKSGEAELRATGGFSREVAEVRSLVMREAGVERLVLTQPARVAWSPEWRVEGLRLAGEAGSVAADGGAAKLTVAVEAMGTAWLRAWLVWPGPDWTLERLAGSGAWSDGTLVFTLDGRAMLPLAEGRAAVAEVRVAGGPEGLAVETLRVSSEGQVVVTANGRLPVAIRPGAEEVLAWAADGEVVFAARTEPSALFWTRLAEVSGVMIVDPELEVAVSGSWRAPKGRAELALARIEADPARWPRALPVVEGLRATVRGDAGGMELEQLSLRVAGQEVLAEGRLPVAANEWAALLAEPTRLATTGGTLRIRIPDAEVAALARFMPEYLAPAGRLRLDVALRPDGGWDGFLTLEDAASRPLGPLGVLADVNADLRLAGRSVELRNVSAMMGGRPVTLTGAVDFSDWRNPAPELRLVGENLPMVRRSGILVRTDLDLRMRTTAAGRVGITGVTTLRDSLLLADLRSLLPKGGRSGGPMRRPPYFSVEIPPLNAWTLDVELRGEEFLKLRTPLFNGLMSARFRLSGTLGEPRLTGEATVDRGTVRLPFATFAVEQGTVRVSEADPNALRLSLAATARRHGYALRMEVGGTAAAPELTFTSSPPLTSEQVLLMVMAGEPPTDEVGTTARQRAVRIGAYLGQSLLGTFGLSPEQSDRLTISVGEKISRQGRETYDVGYALNPRWTLTGEYTEFDEYNVGLKWRFFTSKPEEEAGAEENEKEKENEKEDTDETE